MDIHRGGIVDILDRGCRRWSSPVDMERVGVTGRWKRMICCADLYRERPREGDIIL